MVLTVLVLMVLEGANPCTCSAGTVSTEHL